MTYQKHFPKTIHSLLSQAEIKNQSSFISIEKIKVENAQIYSGFKRSSCFEILVTSEGGGIIEIDLKQHVFTKSLICIVLPGQQRRFRLNDDAKGYYLSFSNDFLFFGAASKYCFSWCSFLCEANNMAIISTDNEAFAEINILLNKMMNEFYSNHCFKKEVLSGLLNILLIDIARILPAELREMILQRDNALTTKFTQLIKTNYLTKKQVGDYASLLCVSPSYLNATIKKHTHHTAKYHIQQQIIVEAKRLLMSNPSMKETAYSLGFEDPSHFSKFFKRNAGINFKNFRASF